MTKPVRAMLFCLILLGLAEAGLRALVDAAPRTAGLPAKDPLLFCLGTSRTMAGLDPAAMEAALRESGIADPWVANLSQDGITTFGTYEMYMTNLHPLAVDSHRKGVVAIEVRPSGLNDKYATPTEAARWAAGEYRELFAQSRASLAGEDDGFHLGAWTRAQVGRFRLGDGRETLDKLEKRLAASDGVPAWAKGAKGFVPYVEGRKDDLDVDRWRFHYEKVLLKEFAFGNVQFELLKRLVMQVKADGFEPVLYVMPVTDVQKTFWPKGRYEQVMAAVRRWTQESKLPLFDFDAGNAFTHADFFDTHHLTRDAAERISAEFARKVFLPRAR